MSKHATYGNIRFPKWECENIDFSMISPIGRIQLNLVGVFRFLISGMDFNMVVIIETSTQWQVDKFST